MWTEELESWTKVAKPSGLSTCMMCVERVPKNISSDTQPSTSLLLSHSYCLFEAFGRIYKQIPIDRPYFLLLFEM